MKQLHSMSLKEDSCQICCDLTSVMELFPCRHRGFCETCSMQLENCPLCRCEILSRNRLPSIVPTEEPNQETSIMTQIPSSPRHGNPNVTSGRSSSQSVSHSPDSSRVVTNPGTASPIVVHVEDDWNQIKSAVNEALVMHFSIEVLNLIQVLNLV